MRNGRHEININSMSIFSDNSRARTHTGLGVSTSALVRGCSEVTWPNWIIHGCHLRLDNRWRCREDRPGELSVPGKRDRIHRFGMGQWHTSYETETSRQRASNGDINDMTSGARVSSESKRLKEAENWTGLNSNSFIPILPYCAHARTHAPTHVRTHTRTHAQAIFRTTLLEQLYTILHFTRIDLSRNHSATLPLLRED